MAAMHEKTHERAHFHHGAKPVRKSVSVHGDTAMLPSSPTEVCASDNDSGAGPRTTLPFSSYCEPWHGQQNLFAALFHGTVQPKCVHTAPMPKPPSNTSVGTAVAATTTRFI